MIVGDVQHCHPDAAQQDAQLLGQLVSAGPIQRAEGAHRASAAGAPVRASGPAPPAEPRRPRGWPPAARRSRSSPPAPAPRAPAPGAAAQTSSASAGRNSHWRPRRDAGTAHAPGTSARSPCGGPEGRPGPRRPSGPRQRQGAAGRRQPATGCSCRSRWGRGWPPPRPRSPPSRARPGPWPSRTPPPRRSHSASTDPRLVVSARAHTQHRRTPVLSYLREPTLRSLPGECRPIGPSRRLPQR